MKIALGNANKLVEDPKNTSMESDLNHHILFYFIFIDSENKIMGLDTDMTAE